ncbi:hypothetical protein SISSUDRAFT_1038075 [Sistotremastrum suecicum HHB10207 ss-3]|uniref:DUF6535 domain-containing protein n=1 Tax=Sistotremastrum suecicum HHB10207 ss-3 TaxID=1314776 RepID=A0A165X927_9AGAM|nr:hypothetical protein SISSUDRAFT_1038075 [Sistotremastrum suecicum HHB10207 ss-3]
MQESSGNSADQRDDSREAILGLLRTQKEIMLRQEALLTQMRDKFDNIAFTNPAPREATHPESNLPSPSTERTLSYSSVSPVSPQDKVPSDTTNALKDASPGSQQGKKVIRREIDDDLGWSAILPVALKRIRQKVKSWKDSLDTTLLFIALFSAIVTAFLLPTLSALSPAPGQNTDQLLQNLIEFIAQTASLNGLTTPAVTQIAPFVPADSDEIAVALWYSSLIFSILECSEYS